MCVYVDMCITSVSLFVSVNCVCVCVCVCACVWCSGCVLGSGPEARPGPIMLHFSPIMLCSNACQIYLLCF